MKNGTSSLTSSSDGTIVSDAAPENHTCLRASFEESRFSGSKIVHFRMKSFAPSDIVVHFSPL